jgi:hypothetical protein
VKRGVDNYRQLSFLQVKKRALRNHTYYSTLKYVMGLIFKYILNSDDLFVQRSYLLSRCSGQVEWPTSAHLSMIHLPSYSLFQFFLSVFVYSYRILKFTLHKSPSTTMTPTLSIPARGQWETIVLGKSFLHPSLPKSEFQLKLTCTVVGPSQIQHKPMVVHGTTPITPTTRQPHMERVPLTIHFTVSKNISIL